MESKYFFTLETRKFTSIFRGMGIYLSPSYSQAIKMYDTAMSALKSRLKEYKFWYVVERPAGMSYISAGAGMVLPEYAMRYVHVRRDLTGALMAHLIYQVSGDERYLSAFEHAVVVMKRDILTSKFGNCKEFMIRYNEVCDQLAKSTQTPI